MADLEQFNEVIPQKRLLTPFMLRKIPPVPDHENRQVYPERTANWLSHVFFWWLSPVMKRGYKRTLVPDDLFALPDYMKVEHMTKKFYDIFYQDYENAKRKHVAKKLKKNPNMSEEEAEKDFTVPKFLTMFAVIKTFKWQYFFSCLSLALAQGGFTTNPLLSKKLIQYVELKAVGMDSGVGKGIGYAFGLAAMVLVNGIFINHFFYRLMLTGAEAKAVLTKALLEKLYKLLAFSKHKYPQGKITLMMGTDLARIDFALGLQPYLIIFPIPLGVAIAILIVNIGPVALIGVALLFVFIVAISFLTKKLFQFRRKATVFTDLRVNYIKEALNNLKVIKFYSWEPPYHDNILDIRRKEMKIIKRMQMLRNIVLAVATVLTLFALMVTFLVLYGVNKNKNRDPALIFSSVSLFNVLAQQVIMMPMALALGADAMLGMLRVGLFLVAEETDAEASRIQADEETAAIMAADSDAIRVDNALFVWELFDDEDSPAKSEKAEVEQVKLVSLLHLLLVDTKREEQVNEKLEEMAKFTGLHDIDLTIRKGEFIVITGVIGLGKSSLLAALLGFMKRTSGLVAVNGSLLLCGYPWVQNATVKENILFGSPFDQKRYDDVIYACLLELDLEILPGGDLAEIGERGITLSGGQKARINLARAVYANRDIILMDDVLSAVDARVGKHIMNECFMGLLKKKTRVLATHQLLLIGTADRVVFLNADGTCDVGTFQQLSETNPDFQNLMTFSLDQAKKEEDEAEIELIHLEVVEKETELIQRQVLKLLAENEDVEAVRHDLTKLRGMDGKIIADEEKAINAISWRVYWMYFKLGSGRLPPALFLPLLILICTLATFCQLFTNVWLSFWTEHKFRRSDGFYIGIYVMFTCMAFITLIIEYLLLVHLTNTAATTLNVKAVKRVLHAPMAYMDVTPMGRILNRFTKDTDVLDNEVGDQLRFFIFVLSQIIGVLILCICYLPWFAIAIPFLAILFVLILNYYQALAREIKRLEAVQRSFVYNNFNETLSGMATIKAYDAGGRFMERLDHYIDRMNEAYYVTIANQRWLALQMDFVAVGVALLVALLSVFRVFNILAASVGLLVSYVFQIAGQLLMLIRTYTQVENEMNSAERLYQYACNLPEEAPYVITETTPPPEWPAHGQITFDNALLAYRPGLPLVLKNLSFDVKPHEKIGICGRTGAGKSSIMTALYRLQELSLGKIEIDGIDISTLGLQALRSKLLIIPQDPVLFRGTVRYNLDPFNQHSNEKLWDALRRTGLIEQGKLAQVMAQTRQAGADIHKFHLDQPVEDDGANFSLGERQLIAFARALVRDLTILILDEATSLVDYETDSKIQLTVILEFAQCTILCIAHRLKTILNYDRILVLDRGEIAEFDTPYNLFRKDGLIFQQMCQRSNITEADFSATQNF
ncbi:ATP-binding cassette domain-containing protein [Kocuria palustris]|nr:ATP-binding cassette domain-containing protein [Kocuria palustris]